MYYVKVIDSNKALQGILGYDLHYHDCLDEDKIDKFRCLFPSKETAEIFRKAAVKANERWVNSSDGDTVYDHTFEIKKAIRVERIVEDWHTQEGDLETV